MEKKLTIRNHMMFGEVMSDPGLCRGVLEVLLGERVGELRTVEKEKSIAYTADGKPIRLDILTEDSFNRSYYNVEMQNLNHHRREDYALGKRSRYYQAMIDAEAVTKRMLYKDLYGCSIIFICTFDPFGEGRYRYTFRSRCDEDNGLLLDDGTRRIFFNTKSKEETIPEPVKRLFEYIETEAIEDELTGKQEQAVESVRERGNIDVTFWAYEANMQDSYFDGYTAGEERGEARGRDEGRSEGRMSMLQDLVRDGVLTAEDAAARLNMTVDEFRGHK